MEYFPTIIETLRYELGKSLTPAKIEVRCCDQRGFVGCIPYSMLKNLDEIWYHDHPEHPYYAMVSCRTDPKHPLWGVRL